ncbi:hypothetical protein Tco_0473473, partial [Tanacetum coccineum]
MTLASFDNDHKTSRDLAEENHWLTTSVESAAEVENRTRVVEVAGWRTEVVDLRVSQRMDEEMWE